MFTWQRPDSVKGQTSHPSVREDPSLKLYSPNIPAVTRASSKLLTQQMGRKSKKEQGQGTLPGRVKNTRENKWSPKRAEGGKGSRKGRTARAKRMGVIERAEERAEGRNRGSSRKRKSSKGKKRRERRERRKGGGSKPGGNNSPRSGQIPF